MPLLQALRPSVAYVLHFVKSKQTKKLTKHNLISVHKILSKRLRGEKNFANAFFGLGLTG